MKNRIIFGLISLAFLLVVTMSQSTTLVVCAAAVIAVAIWEMWVIVGRKNIWAFLLFSLIIIAGFSCVALIRMSEFGEYTIYFAFGGAFLTDTFAYIFGMWLGQKNGHKLAPKISPKKSWEGAIGGVVGTTISFVVWGVCLGLKLNPPMAIAIAEPIAHVEFTPFVIMGFLSSIIAQLGDLAASWVKRRYGVKDYGRIIPGHGGIMDRCDSLLFVAPFVYIFMKFFPIIV